MRIGFVISALHGGGAEFVVRQWTDRLCATGHEVVVYTYEPSAATRDLPLGASHRHFSPPSRALRALGLPWWLRYRVKRDNLDVLVTMMTFANLAGIVGLRLMRPSTTTLVISERSAMTVALPLQGTNARAKAWLARRMYRMANGIVAISHPVAADLIGGYRADPQRTFVVPNPVITDGADLETTRPAALHLLFVGRLVTAKNPTLFVDTLVELTKQGVSTTGTVVGDGPLREATEAYACNSSVKLKFLGWQEPWWEVVTDADCLLLPSAVEGFGNVLVEAAAAGVPCVASSSALGVADAIIPGLTGELAIGSRPQDLAEAVIRATANSDAEPIQRWLRRFSSVCSTEALVSAIKHISTDVTADKRARN